VGWCGRDGAQSVSTGDESRMGGGGCRSGHARDGERGDEFGEDSGDGEAVAVSHVAGAVHHGAGGRGGERGGVVQPVLSARLRSRRTRGESATEVVGSGRALAAITLAGDCVAAFPRIARG